MIDIVVIFNIQNVSSFIKNYAECSKYTVTQHFLFIGRHLSRTELATMSNLEKRLQGKRTGPQSLLDKHELKQQSQKKYAYRVSQSIGIQNLSNPS